MIPHPEPQEGTAEMSQSVADVGETALPVEEGLREKPEFRLPKILWCLHSIGPDELDAAPGHTPGPWRIDPDATFIGDHYVGTDTADIALMADWSLDLEPEQWANARLIAAAPDLLAALVALTEEAHRNMIGGHGALIDDARAAIRKATS